MTTSPLSRAHTFVAYALLFSLLVACSSASPTATPVPTVPPEPTNTPAPTAALASTERLEPTATLEPIETATPKPTDTPASSPKPVTGMTEAQVVEVVDGDTIKVEIDGEVYSIRYIGIDCPETKDPSKPVEWMGPEASAANTELVDGKTVLLEKDVSETDQYGRLLRYVYVEDLFVNLALVKLGVAQVSTYPPDVKYVDMFTQAQQEAREKGRGLWSELPTPTSAPIETPEPTGTQPPQPTATQTPRPTAAEQPTPVPIDCLDSAYVADVTVPDNTTFDPGEAFVKTWRVRNTGDCPWPEQSALVFVSDDDLDAPESVPVGLLEPGETIDISVEMEAPAADGRYEGTWRLSDGSGQQFGGQLTVVIRVSGAPAPTAVPTQPAATQAPPSTATPVPPQQPTATLVPTQPLPTPTLAPTEPPPPPPANVVISHILFDGAVPNVESDEYAQITNNGGSAVNLAGWRLNADDAGQDFWFPSFELQPGQSCRVYTNENHPDTCGFSFGSGKALWANSGECGHLYNSEGAEVSTYCY